MIHSVDGVDNPGYEFQKIEEEETIFSIFFSNDAGRW